MALFINGEEVYATHRSIKMEETLTKDNTYSGITCDGVAGYGGAFTEHL